MGNGKTLVVIGDTPPVDHSFGFRPIGGPFFGMMDPSMDPAGDIRSISPADGFSAAIRAAMARHYARREQESTPEPQASYFVTERVLTVDENKRRERIEAFQREHNCSMSEATYRINAIILKEMLGQLSGPEDLVKVRQWAAEHIS